MEKDYQTKDMRPDRPKKNKKDGEIYKDGDLYKFNWIGSECGYSSKDAAEDGLKKVSGTAED